MGSSPHTGPVGEDGGGSFTGTFMRKRKLIYGFIFSNSEDIKILVWGPCVILARNRAPLS